MKYVCIKCGWIAPNGRTKTHFDHNGRVPCVGKVVKIQVKQ